MLPNLRFSRYRLRHTVEEPLKMLEYRGDSEGRISGRWLTLRNRVLRKKLGFFV